MINTKVLWRPLSTALILSTGMAHAFNNHDFKGGYAFKFNGPSSIVLAHESLTVATGQMFADGSGHVTGRGRFRSAGVTCEGTITGSYNILLNGTGSLSSVMDTSTPGCFTTAFDLAMVLSNKGERFDVMSTEHDDLVGQLTQQDKINFKPTDFKGAYALSFSGTSTMVSAEQALTIGVGVLTSEGKGKVSGMGTIRSSGVTCHGVFKGIYHVSADGIGDMSTHFTTKDPGCLSTVLDLSMAMFKHGGGAHLASVDNDHMVGSLHRQVIK